MVKKVWRYPFAFDERRGRQITAHQIIAERALGKKLPPGVGVHHVDGNNKNNDPTNLVIYPSMSYHRLLHKRTRAYEACGNANWLKCKYCQRWDDPKNLQIYQYETNCHVHHSECSKKFQVTKRAKAKRANLSR